ncbi:trans-sulfuration enzyme family protein [Paenibacillus contaminans]|uniref:trans-sulfuration enzyme family protein n=1 Tax=Paenibacillus contaminans TaxID=450362 RepID=UPI001EDD4154|nr:PLP-dependent aspartate aminotransferase family protein [Paenibacillus contaminans]
MNEHEKASRSTETIVVHDAQDDRHYGAVAMPIYQNSVFTFPTQQSFEEAMLDNRDHFMYTRGNNPSVRQLEERLARLEGGEQARCFASGMAAISTAVISLVRSGDHIICVDQAYGPAKDLMTSILTRFGVETTYVNGASFERIAEAVKPNTKLLYLESPTSMRFELQDLPRCAELAKQIGAYTVIDNTWASPIYQNPLQLGIDLVVHSVTKYIGGHSDLVGGVIIGSKQLLHKINGCELVLLGGIMQPSTAAQVMRGLRTLPLRMEKLQQNGLAVARFLETEASVAKVNHPGLPSHPQHELFNRQMKGGGSLFSVELAVTVDQARTWADSLEYFRKGFSWGGYESLLYMPIQSPDTEAGENVLIRLYIGLEDPEDIIRNMRDAFARIAKK